MRGIRIWSVFDDTEFWYLPFRSGVLPEKVLVRERRGRVIIQLAGKTRDDVDRGAL